MQRVRLKLGKRSYQIIVGSGILKSLGKRILRLDIGRDAYIITNSFLKKRFGRDLERWLSACGIKSKFKTVPDSERSKSIAQASGAITGLAGFDLARRVFIIAFGGGVIGDLAGFVASVYKRGIPYLQVPTTLLAQVDSSIGGKTGVDLRQGKNLIGAFYQPRLVLSDVSILSTLDIRQVRAGLAEVVKYAAIKDKVLFFYLENNYKDILSCRKDALEYVVGRCSRIKAEIVAGDEREEKGLRTILNFGHTIGHAIEAASSYRGYNHGEAIALGMLCAVRLGVILGLTAQGLEQRVASLLKKIGLPCRIKGLSLERIIAAHYRDKKFIGKKNKFVLVANIGRAKIVEDIPLETIKRSIKEVISPA
jgi:3-dehydroquinate synthase